MERVDLSRLILDTSTNHPREVVSALVDAVTIACGGNVRDDATVLCLDWHGPQADTTRPGPDDTRRPRS